MACWKTPTELEVSRAIALLAHPLQRRYFFDRLNNPEWIAPLKKMHFFSVPPKPQEKHSGIFFPLWPEAYYLARMADKKPDAVCDIILDISDNDNIRVREDFIDAALSMPPRVAVKLIEKAKIWASSKLPLRFLPEKLGSLIQHFAEGGCRDEALALAIILLDVLPDTRFADIVDGFDREHYRSTPEPGARFELSVYQGIIKVNFPALLFAAKIDAFFLICDLLNKAIELSRRREDDAGPEDYSSLWRPAVMDSSQNTLQDIRSILVSGVRDSARYLLKENIADINTIIQSLEARTWTVFFRIALHILSIIDQPPLGLIEDRLLKEGSIDDSGIQHEYARLLDKYFKSISSIGQNKILNQIEKGPDQDEFRQWRQGRGAVISDEDFQKYKKVWQRNKLAWFKDKLPQEWRQYYDSLVAEFNEPEHPEFSTYFSSSVGPVSPKTEEQLQIMSVEEVIGVLNDCLPSGEPTAPSPDGLGRIFSSVVSKTPEKFTAEAKSFIGLDPTYIRSLLDGLNRALSENRRFSWDFILELCLWVVSQPREIPGRKQYGISCVDPDWGWTRDVIARLISGGLRDEQGGIFFTSRDIVWKILGPLAKDPDPTVEREGKYCISGDPSNLAINSTRGEAFNAVIHYALWVRRNVEKLLDSRERLNRGFEEIKEVRTVLDFHLDIAQEPSLAIRTVYGRWFPWLALLDEKWARNNVSLIFPIEDSEDYFYAAWNAYVIFCKPYDNIYEVLYKCYSFAIDKIGIKKAEYKVANPIQRLGEHLVELYWRGRLDNDKGRTLMNKFWDKADPAVRACAVEFIGRSLHSEKNVIPEEIIQRLQILWRERLIVAKRSGNFLDYAAEMASFGWWFISGKFDNLWVLKQLLEAIKISGYAEPEHLIFSKLEEHLGISPVETMACVDLLLKGDKEGWGIYSWNDSLRLILSKALKIPAVSEQAKNIVHYLGSRGHLEFRGLVNL